MLGHGRQDGLACAEQVVRADLDLAREIAFGRGCVRQPAGLGATGPHAKHYPQGAQGKCHQGHRGKRAACEVHVHRSSIG